MKIALEFEEVRPDEKRTMFISKKPYAPKDIVYLDNERIYAIKRWEDKIYVIYETDNVEFYSHYSSHIPRNAKDMDKLILTLKVCANCETEIEYDADEPFCPRCDDEVRIKVIEEVVWTPKPYNDSEVKVLPIPSIDNAVITSNNFKFYASQISGISGDLKEGYIVRGGSQCVQFVRKDEERKVNVLRVTKGVGVELISSWDESPTVVNPGYYIMIRHEDIAIDKVYYTKLRELNDDEKKLIASHYAKCAIEDWGWDKEFVANAIRENRNVIDNYSTEFLLSLGLNDLVIENLKTKLEGWLEKWDQSQLHGFYEARVNECLNILKDLHVDVSAYEHKVAQLKKIAEEAKRKEEERKKQQEGPTTDEIVSKIPDWADCAIVYRNRIIPAKCSKFNKKQYYFCPSWKEIASFKTAKEFVIFKDGRMKDVKFKSVNKYVVFEIVEK